MKVAITGGIGSGKSYVCERLRQRGIVVYDCDAAAKRLMRESEELKRQLCQLVGDEVYKDGVLQKPVLAAFLLWDAEHAQAVNDIVHPAVAHDFEQSGMTWLESAIFFDSGFNRRVRIDKVVCVSAPVSIRLERVMRRDHITEAKAAEWIACQLPEEEVARRSDYVIVNDGVRSVDEQLDTMLSQISEDNHQKE